MIARVCFALVLIAATYAEDIKYRPIRQTTTAPDIKWTMYTVPEIAPVDPKSETDIDPGFIQDPSLEVYPLDRDEKNFTIYVDPKWDFKCPSRFGYYRIEQSCDLYIECRNFRPIRKLCPDGMHFKDLTRWSEYPCAYPSEAPCLVRGGAQPPRASGQCPHQFGFYAITDKTWPVYERCRHYIACSAGVAKMMNCSMGLVFNPVIERCDWPENVPECRDFLGFRCPVPAFGEEDMVINFKYATDPECRYFFSCHNGQSRVLSCEDGLAFDAATGKCVDEELVQCVSEVYVPDTPYNDLESLKEKEKGHGFSFEYNSLPLPKY